MLFRSNDKRIKDWQLYDFDASDSYLYSTEFLNILQSKQETKYQPYRNLMKLLEADPDTPYYKPNNK